MAYDEALAERIRAKLGKRKGVTEKKMFGGLAVLVNGKMCVGVHGNDMIARIDPTETLAALKQPHTRVFDLTGRPMKGWILVEPKGVATEAMLSKWIAGRGPSRAPSMHGGRSVRQRASSDGDVRDDTRSGKSDPVDRPQ